MRMSERPMPVMTEEREHSQNPEQRHCRHPGSMLPNGLAQNLPEALQMKKIVINPDQAGSKLPP
jgi:hypothetical protein